MTAGMVPAYPTHRPFDKSTVLTDLSALASILIVMVAVNQEWVFNAFRWVDTWMYVGFFQHYDFPAMLEDNKKIARLPWVLYGYAINHLTSPVAGQFIIHLSMLAAGTTAFYLVARRQFGRGIAVLASAFYLTYVPGHGNGGWDYNNTPSGLLYILTYASLLNLTERFDQPRLRGAIVGIAGATLLHVNLLFILIGPALALFVADCACIHLDRPALRAWAKQIMWSSLAGALGLTLALAIFNLICGRDFVFFQRLIDRTALMMVEPSREKVWWLPWSDPWWYDSTKLPLNGYHMPLILIVLALIVMTALLAAVTRATVTRTDKQVIGLFLASLFVFVLMQTSGHPLLQPYYMAFPLLPPTMFALAALLRILFATSEQPAGPAWNGVASLFACTTFAVLFEVLSASPGNWHFGELKAYDDRLGLLPVLGGFMVAWLSLRLSPAARRWTTGLAAGGMALALATTNGGWPSDPAYREAYSYRNECRTRQAVFDMVVEADRALFNYIKAGSNIPMVYRAGETIRAGGCDVQLAEVARPLASMGYGVVMPYWKMEPLPEIPDDVVDEAAKQQTTLAVMTNNQSGRDRLLARLRTRSPEWHVDSETVLGGDATGARLTVLSRSPARPRSGA